METSPVRGWWSQSTKEVKAARWLGVALMAIVVAVMAPIVITLVKAAVGLIVLVGVLIVGVALLNLAPRISRWLTLKGANFFLRLMKDEAAKNPIETMQNTLLERTQDLENAGEELANLGAQIKLFEKQMAEHKARFGAEDSSELDEALTIMRQSYGELEENFKAAAEALAQYKRKIDIAESKWKMAITSQSILRSLKPGGENALITKILNEVAMESVEKAFHTSFGKLQLSLTAVKQLPHQKSSPFRGADIVDVETKPVPVGVRR